MPVSRADLIEDALRRAIAGSPLAERLLSDEALQASLDAVLARRPPGPELWLFGYGSLVWNPSIEFLERRPGIVRGWHRRFCLWSQVIRGTAERPGLALGLEPGGACRGVVFRLEPAVAREELAILWRREMMFGSYTPRWVRATSRGETHPALTFTINRAAPHYAGRLPDARVVEVLLGARGLYGSGADYLLRTVEGLQHCGIRDAHLERLRALVLARMRSGAPA
jgi:cation transport protein ChaC